MLGQNETCARAVENSPAVKLACNGRAEVESSESGSSQLLADVTSWHTGWIVTELPRDLILGFSLPAFFHSVVWDDSNKNLVLTLVPEIIDLKASTLRMVITGVIGIHFCPSTLRPPERLICLEREMGETSIIRLELDLGRRRTYQQYHGLRFKEALPPDL